jgi:hypothetical protein
MPRGIPGPVVDGPKKKANKGTFTKERPGPGRPKGVPNKFTQDLREAILAGINGSHPDGITGFVQALAMESPTAAAALLGRFVPLQTEHGKPGDFSNKTEAELRDIIAADLRALGLSYTPPKASRREEETGGAGRLN